jgi:hypothetical protein
MTVIWKLKQNHTLLNGCLFGDTFADPCLKEWSEGGHANVYSSGEFQFFPCVIWLNYMYPT